MKKIALIFFVIFGLVQAGPAFASLVNPHHVIFMVDEEKHEDKSKSEKKEGKKELPRPYSLSGYHKKHASARQYMDEQILPSPCIEKVCPPPNGY